MHKKNQQNRIDSSKFTARFGCGFIVGILIAGSTAIVYGAQTIIGLIVAWIIFAILCGLLSAIFGDKFWHHIIHWLR
jgi:uncharacterized membrane protein YciS (DUF1049 family)